jgi:hypothetical protein
MAKNFEPCVFLKLTDKGVVDMRIATNTAAEQEAAHVLLGKLSFEINQLNEAAKDAGSVLVK